MFTFITIKFILDLLRYVHCTCSGSLLKDELLLKFAVPRVYLLVCCIIEPFSILSSVYMSIFHSYSVFHFYSRTMVSFITHQVAIDSARQVERGSCYGIVVQSNGATWVVQRDVASLTLLDRQLHYCVFDRGYSKLRDLEVLSTVSVKVSYLRHVIPFIEITE